MAMSWRTARAAAMSRWNASAVWRKISTSSVGWRGPPRIRTTPNDVKVKRNTIDAAATMAGRSKGSVTSRKARHREAPSTRAASSMRGSRCAHKALTVRTTMA
jgi:hypothetical protein